MAAKTLQAMRLVVKGRHRSIAGRRARSTELVGSDVLGSGVFRDAVRLWVCAESVDDVVAVAPAPRAKMDRTDAVLATTLDLS